MNSYGELNERANRLAHYLREQGVGPEVIVGVSMERSIEMIVALLGILKAGGAYLPLDPNYPSERISYMLDDCGAAVLLTREEFQSRFVDHSISTIYLNSDSKNFDTYSRQNLPLTSNAQNLAYVMYTSGWSSIRITSHLKVTTEWHTPQMYHSMRLLLRSGVHCSAGQPW
jgi:non-ribosomal peptide synthetase component F